MGSRIVEVRVFEPIVTERADGFLTVDWPEDEAPVCLVARELLLPLIDRLNKAVV